MKALRIPAAQSKPVLLTLDEGRAALRVGKNQFNELRQAGLVETVKIGRSVRVVAESVASLPARLRAGEDR
jgi:hypothetical protein